MAGAGTGASIRREVADTSAETLEDGVSIYDPKYKHPVRPGRIISAGQHISPFRFFFYAVLVGLVIYGTLAYTTKASAAREKKEIIQHHLRVQHKRRLKEITDRIRGLAGDNRKLLDELDDLFDIIGLGQVVLVRSLCTGKFLCVGCGKLTLQTAVTSVERRTEIKAHFEVHGVDGEYLAFKSVDTQKFLRIIKNPEEGKDDDDDKRSSGDDQNLADLDIDNDPDSGFLSSLKGKVAGKAGHKSPYTLAADAQSDVDHATQFRIEDGFIFNRGTESYLFWDETRGLAFVDPDVSPGAVRDPTWSKGCSARFVVEPLDKGEEVTLVNARLPPIVFGQKQAWNSDLVVVTAGSEKYFHQVLNFVGSVHVWEPDVRVVVYNIGMNEEQVAAAGTWRNVELVHFEFEAHPPHVKDLSNFAWRPIVMNETMSRYPKIFYSDPTVEFRRPIDEVRALVDVYGYFFVHLDGLHTERACCGPIGEMTHPLLYSELGMDPSDGRRHYMCAGGVQGWLKDSQAYKNVFLPTLECAKNPECIQPDGATSSNHRFDASVSSLLIARENLICQCHSRFFAYKNTAPPTRVVTKTNSVVLYMRRGHEHPYASYVQLAELDLLDVGNLAGP